MTASERIRIARLYDEATSASDRKQEAWKKGIDVRTYRALERQCEHAWALYFTARKGGLRMATIALSCPTRWYQ